MSSPAMSSLEMVGASINVIGLVVPMVFSAAIALFYRKAYFQIWTLNYVFMTASITLLPLTDMWGRPLWATTFVLTLYYTHIYLTAENAYALEQRRMPLVGRVGFALTLAVVLGMNVARADFLALCGLVAVVNVGTHVLFGVALMRYAGPGPRATRIAVGSLVIAVGLWTVFYPVMQGAGLTWAGYAIAGVLHLFVGVAMVVFLLEEAAEQLRAQNEELKQVDRLKTNFIATVSHELRTPLTVIKGSTSILQDGLVGPLTPAQQQQLSNVESNTEALIHQINDLLDFSKLDAGMMEFRHEPGDLAATVRQAAERFGGLFEAREQHFSLQLEEAPLPATVDHARLQQVVGNLLSNAAKFAPAGGHVTLTLSRQGDQAQLEVRDTGDGIPPEELERVFLRFYQVDGSVTRKVGGSGLGLAICRSIVEGGHGGRIWAENVSPHGTRFVVTLPVTARHATVPQALAPSVPGHSINLA